MKTKIKTKTKVAPRKKKTTTKKKTTVAKPVRKKAKQYHPSYLGLIVVGVLLLEGFLFSVATPTDWKYGVEILDIRPAVAEAAADVAEIFSPMVELTHSVNQFYVLTADELIPLLDLSDAVVGVGEVYMAIDSFYNQASIAMAEILAIPQENYFGSIAGASIHK